MGWDQRGIGTVEGVGEDGTGTWRGGNLLEMSLLCSELGQAVPISLYCAVRLSTSVLGVDATFSPIETAQVLSNAAPSTLATPHKRTAPDARRPGRARHTTQATNDDRRALDSTNAFLSQLNTFFCLDHATFPFPPSLHRRQGPPGSQEHGLRAGTTRRRSPLAPPSSPPTTALNASQSALLECREELWHRH